MIEAGYCMICGAKTHTICSACGSKKFNDQHTEVEMKWSNGSKMMVGVCVTCAVKNAHHDPAHKEKVAKAHHDHWMEQGGKVDRGVTLV